MLKLISNLFIQYTNHLLYYNIFQAHKYTKSMSTKNTFMEYFFAKIIFVWAIFYER